MSLSNEQIAIYKKELDKVNKELDQLGELLKESIDTMGLEYIDLNRIIDLCDTLTTKKSKLIYLIGVQGI